MILAHYEGWVVWKGTAGSGESTCNGQLYLSDLNSIKEMYSEPHSHV